jgi:DNA-binding XRE family transcriptional regulator
MKNKKQGKEIEVKVDSKKIEEGIRTGKLIPLEKIISEMPLEEQRRVEAISEYYGALFELRELREKEGITQEELSLKSGVARDAISKIEAGKRNVTLETLINLASAMGKRVQIKLV